MSAPADAAGLLRPGLREGLCLIVLAFIWGGSFLFIGLALESLPPFTLAALRIVIAALCLWGVVGMSGRAHHLRGQNWGAFTIMGVLNNVVPFCAIIWAQLTITSGLAAILVATTPLLGLVCAGMLLPDEPLTGKRLLAGTIGCAGVALIAGAQTLRGDHAEIVATVACLAGAFSFALAGVFGRRFARDRVAPLTVATGQLTASACLITPIALLAETPWMLPVPSITSVTAVLALGIVSTACAYLLYFRILAAAGASNLLLVNLLVPVPAILFGARWLNESPHATDLVGLVFIATALFASDPRLWCRRGATE